MIYVVPVRHHYLNENDYNGTERDIFRPFYTHNLLIVFPADNNTHAHVTRDQYENDSTYESLVARCRFTFQLLTLAHMHHKVVGNFGSEADVRSLYYRR